MDFVAIDFETTGRENGSANEPWQLGAVKVVNGEITEQREWFFAPSQHCPGVPEFAYDSAPIAECWDEFAPFLIGNTLVAHNIGTERTILTRLAPLTRWGPWIDTLKQARIRYPKLASYRLGELCTLFNCVPTLPNRTWHDALFDAHACALLAMRIAINC